MALEPLSWALEVGVRTEAEARAEAFAALYEAQFDRVYAFLRYRVGDDALAEDLAAEVFVRAWAKLEALDGGGAPERAVAWLFTTARRLVIDHYRGRRDVFPLEGLHLGDHLAAGSPEAQVISAEQAGQVRRHLAELGEREREVIGLRFVAGLRHRVPASGIGSRGGGGGAGGARGRGEQRVRPRAAGEAGVAARPRHGVRSGDESSAGA